MPPWLLNLDVYFQLWKFPDWTLNRPTDGGGSHCDVGSKVKQTCCLKLDILATEVKVKVKDKDNKINIFISSLHSRTSHHLDIIVSTYRVYQWVSVTVFILFAGVSWGLKSSWKGASQATDVQIFLSRALSPTLKRATIVLWTLVFEIQPVLWPFSANIKNEYD